MISPARLEAIKARYEAATPGPWTSGEYGGDPGTLIVWDAEDTEVAAITTDGQLRNEEAGRDADFIAHARQDVPDLLQEVERLNALLGAIVLATSDQRRSELSRLAEVRKLASEGLA